MFEVSVLLYDLYLNFHFDVLVLESLRSVNSPIYLNFQIGFANDLIIITGIRISQEPFITQTCAYMQNKREGILSLPM
jgi:hypothetical protein